jgi:ribonucleoside-diphosphate reductase beta chain
MASEPAAPHRTDRSDFRATSDPALDEAADRGEANLLTYGQLYELWERQHWATRDLDFTQDRIDWHERFDDDERFQRMYGMSAFFVGEQRVAAELGPIMRAVPDEDMRIFLCTQIADEARHVAFFDRFYSEVEVLEATGLEARLAATSEHLNPEFGQLFDDSLHRRVDRLAAEPEDLETLVEAITIYHMVLEGMLALTGQHFIIDYNERAGTLPGFVDGFTKVARDGDPRLVGHGDPHVRGEGAGAAAEGDRAGGGGVRSVAPRSGGGGRRDVSGQRGEGSVNRPRGGGDATYGAQSTIFRITP